MKLDTKIYEKYKAEGGQVKNNRLLRGSGILLSITSLPSPYGIGTLGTEAYRFLDLLADLRQRYWQVLPIGPTSYGDSPYQSFSAFAGNPYLIDLDLLAEQGLLIREEVSGLRWGEDDQSVDYGLLFSNRFDILRQAYARFDGNADGFREFCRIEADWLDDYSLFMSLKTCFNNREWLSWEKPIRNREPRAVARYQELLSEQILFWKFLQYLFYQQWEKVKEYAALRGISIIGDIPLYVSLDSADVWAARNQFLLDVDGNPTEVAGCPPDAFSDDGQKWGNPLYNWDYMEEDGYAWWRKRMRFNTRLYDIVRIDHFIGIVKYYSIPSGDETARNGRWNKGPGRKLTEVMADIAGPGRIIAEDLGVAIPAVKKLVDKIKWPRMNILLFAFDGNTANEHLPHNFADGNRVLYTGTHDNETVVGYFRGKTQYELSYLYEYLNIHSQKEIPDAILRQAYASTADVVIIPMQDLLQLDNETRMNLPSTLGTNWRWRSRADALGEERCNFIRTMATIYRR